LGYARLIETFTLSRSCRQLDFRTSQETFAQLLDKPLIGGMITSPKPRSRVTFKYAQSPIAQGDPERPDVGFRFNTFKSERGMEGVFFPDFESLLSCLSGGIWQLTIGFPK